MIIIVSRIKNSADIIESFIRSNGLIADKFIFYDNESSDLTIDILKQLKQEGYDIEFYKDSNFLNRQRDQIQDLINKVRDRYKPDIIIPLDDDEIIASDKIDNIKEYLLNLSCDKLYKIRWRIYTLTGEENQKDKCVLSRITNCYINNEYEYPSIILTKNILDEKNWIVTQGNHGLNWIGEEKDQPHLEVEFLNDLYLAHYPVRSKEQALSKFFIRWTNFASMPLTRKFKNGCYSYKFYEKIKHSNTHNFSIEDLKEIIRGYRQKRGKDLDKIIDKKINLPAECFLIKYNYNEIDPIYNYMCNVEKIIEKLAECYREKGVKDFAYDFNRKKHAM